MGVKNQGSLTKMNKKPSKTKTAKAPKSKTESVSKYFKNDKASLDTINKSEDEPKSIKQIGDKTVFYDSADNDFRSPVVLRKRNDTAWKLNKDTKQKSKSKRASSKKGITTTIQIIKENFQSRGENPEHLQMAIALSKSTYEAEYGHSSEAVIKEETPDISEILQNAKPTNLERFGFKAGKPVASYRSHTASSEPPKRLRNRFKYITPVLSIRSTEDRESLITAKISHILGQSNSNPKERSEQSLISTRLQDYTPTNCAIFQVDKLYESNYFYKDNLNLPKSDYKCGCLLKDWTSIPGRDKSPRREKGVTEHKERATSDKNNCLTVTDNENLLKNINSEHGSDEQRSSEPLKESEKMLVEENPLFSVKTTSLGQQTFTSISSSCRSISPDLFCSDDEQYYDLLNKADELKPLEATASYNRGSDKNSSSANMKIDSNNSEKEFHTEVIDLTDDNTKSGSGSKNSCSFTRLPSFYSLDEFEEDIGSGKGNAGKLIINEEMNFMKSDEVKTINLNMNKDMSLIEVKSCYGKLKHNHEKNNENLNYSENSEDTPCIVPKNSSLTSSDKDPSVTVLNDSLTDHHFKIIRGNSCPPYEHLEENHADLCSSKDPFNIHKSNHCDPVDIENEENVSINTEDIRIKRHSSEHGSFSKINSSDCFQILDDSLPSNLLEDVEILNLTLERGQNPINDLTNPVELSVLNDFVSHDLTGNENPKIDDSIPMNSPLKVLQSNSSEDPEENDVTNSKMSCRLNVIDNCAINNKSKVEHFTKDENTDRSRTSSPKMGCGRQCVVTSPDQILKFPLLNSNMSYEDSDSLSCIEILDDSFSDRQENARNEFCKSEEIHWRDTLNHSGASDYLTEKDSGMKNTLKQDNASAHLSPTSVQTSDEDEEHESRHLITPVKTHRLSSFRNSNVYNSADLNVTDYVNNLLNQENFSFDICDEEIASNENEEMLSQSSQGNVVVDEELNYSSNFATPSKFRAQTDKSSNNFDLLTVENLSDGHDAEEFPVIQKNISSPAPEKPSVVSTEGTISRKAISTPDNYIIKTKNITPMPDYDRMTTPLINKELKRVGVKPLKRARGAKLLKYIYESTHPLADVVEVMENSESEGEERVIKRRKRNREAVSNTESSVKLTHSPCDIEPVSSIEIIGDCIIEKEKPEDLIFERRQSVRIPSCQVPLQIIWHNFLSCNPTIKENILLYEPLQLESLHMMLKEQGFKFHIQDLLTFLDKKCITIRTAQKQGKRHR